MKKKKNKRFFCSFERVMYKLCVVVIILLIVGIVCGQTSLAQVNLEVEKERNVNESLEMKIDEMTSLDRIKQVSQEYGLAYNSDNIKTIK